MSLLTADECFDEIHECDSLAECHNTAGNYTCHCPDGYLSEWKDCIGKDAETKGAFHLSELRAGQNVQFVN